MLNVVLDEQLATAVAEAYVSCIYGQQAAQQQKPYRVTETETHWEVEGVLHGRRLGGTFRIHLAKEGGQVLLLTHSR